MLQGEDEYISRYNQCQQWKSLEQFIQLELKRVQTQQRIKNDDDIKSELFFQKKTVYQLNMIICISNKQIIIIYKRINITKKPIQKAKQMKRALGKSAKKQKHITKQKSGSSAKQNKSKPQYDDDEEIESNSIIEQDSQINPIQPSNEKFQTPEDVKQRIAKNMLEKLNANKNKKNTVNDNFFISDDVNVNIDANMNEEEMISGQNVGKHEDLMMNYNTGKQKGQETYDEEVADQFKHQHLRKQNKLYETMTGYFQKVVIEEPIEYKGHLQTITAVEVTNHSIYSCSKDRSIIRWDRETGKKDFISFGKDLEHHQSDILSMAKHTENDNIIATAGVDTLIKLWDARTKSPIGTLKGHRNTINGLKFGINSNILCSVSKDLTLKEWDVSQRGLMETFYEHNNEVLDIDHMNSTDFISCGNDHQNIIWKTEKETKIIYKGHDYAIDRVRSINQERFVTACMDGSLYLWHAKRNKAVFKQQQAHSGWICALDSLKQSNIFASGATDKMIKLWGIEPEMKGMKLIKEIPMKGIITDIKLFKNEMIATECEEHRLGRWITTKTRNKIKIFKFKQEN